MRLSHLFTLALASGAAIATDESDWHSLHRRGITSQAGSAFDHLFGGGHLNDLPVPKMSRLDSKQFNALAADPLTHPEAHRFAYKQLNLQAQKYSTQAAQLGHRAQNLKPGLFSRYLPDKGPRLKSQADALNVKASQTSAAADDHLKAFRKLAEAQANPKKPRVDEVPALGDRLVAQTKPTTVHPDRDESAPAYVADHLPAMRPSEKRAYQTILNPALGLHQKYLNSYLARLSGKRVNELEKVRQGHTDSISSLTAKGNIDGRQVALPLHEQKQLVNHHLSQKEAGREIARHQDLYDHYHSQAFS